MQPYIYLFNSTMMQISNFEIDLEPALPRILGKKTIMLQSPEGLKMKLPQIAEAIRARTGDEVIISATPCYGACDLADEEAKRCGARALVHIGHSELPCLAGTYAVPVVFLQAQSLIDIAPIVKNAAAQMAQLGIKKVGLVTTAQHTQKLDLAREILAVSGIEAVFGKGDGRIEFPGQVLGCNFTSARSCGALSLGSASAAGACGDVDAYLYIGTGNFHPLGITLSTKKPVFIADPEMNEIRTLEKVKEQIMKRRFAAIARAMDAKRIGIIIGTKVGQCRLPLARQLKKLAEDAGRSAELLSMNYIDPAYIEFLPFDAYACTACPRISIDDQARYKKPVLTPIELEIALGNRRFEEYVFDEILE
jgi:2-(3-amino-3-carboxypropyl)histidine synthase